MNSPLSYATEIGEAQPATQEQQAEQKPAAQEEQKPAAEAQPAAEAKPQEAQPAPQQAVPTAQPEQQPAAQQEQKPAAETQPTETKPEETKPAEQKPATTEQQDEQKPSEEATDEEKPEDTDEEGEAEEEAEPTKTEYEYDDDNVHVVATLERADAIPDDAELRVTPVFASSADYNYDAYMAALNASVADANPYNDQNTLLYDVAFLAKNDEGKVVEIEPEAGSVSVRIEFKRDQLVEDIDVQEASDVDVIHLPLRDGAMAETTAESTGIRKDDVIVEPVAEADLATSGTNVVEIKTDSLSVFAVAFTVDFERDGYTFSIEGKSSIMLSELFAVLGITDNAAFATKVEFSDPELIKVEQEAEDWKLTSLKAFSTKETLTVTMANGGVYVISVTDAMQGSLHGDNNGGSQMQVSFKDSNGNAISSGDLGEAYLYLELQARTPADDTGNTQTKVARIQLTSDMLESGLTQELKQNLFEIWYGGYDNGTITNAYLVANNGSSTAIEEDAEIGDFFYKGTSVSDPTSPSDPLDVTVTLDPMPVYNVEIDFYDYDNSTLAAYNGSDNTLYVYAEIRDSTGKVVGWNVQQINPSGKTSETVSFKKFVDVNSSKDNTNNPTIAYSSDYTVACRVFRTQPTYHNIYEPGQYESTPDDTIDGYQFKGNTFDASTNTSTVRLRKWNGSHFLVHLDYDPSKSTEISESDDYWVRVKLDHTNNYSTYGVAKLTSDGDIEITEWRNGTDGGLINNGEFTGNEPTVSVQIVKTRSGKTASASDVAKLNADCVEAIAAGATVKDYQVAYTSGTMDIQKKDESGNYVNKTDDETKHETDCIYTITLTKQNLTSALTPENILGEAAEFGIVANRYDQFGHSETNFAVNYLYYPANIDIGGSGDGMMPFYTAEITDTAENGTTGTSHIEITDKTSVETDIFVTENDRDRVINNGSQKPVNVYTMDKADIKAYVDGLIASGQAKSAELASHTTMKPTFDGTGYTLDTTGYPDGTTIYVDADGIYNSISSGGWYINKLPNQSIVFNITQSDPVTIGEFYVCPNDDPDGTKYHDAAVNEKYWVQSTTSAVNGNPVRNQRVDDVIFEHITFNVTNASNVHLSNASALFLLPNADKVTQDNGAGWILAKGTVDSHAEWHFYRHNRHYKAEGGFSLRARKSFKTGTSASDIDLSYIDKVYEFAVYMIDSDGNYTRLVKDSTAPGGYRIELVPEGETPVAVEVGKTSAGGGQSIDFLNQKFTNEDFPEGITKITGYYKIVEVIPDDAIATYEDGEGNEQTVNYANATPEQKETLSFAKDDVIYSAEPISIKVVATHVQDNETSGHIEIDAQTLDGTDVPVTEPTDTDKSYYIELGEFINKKSAAKEEIEVTKSYPSWGDSDSFTFRLTAGSNNAQGEIATPMPEGATTPQSGATYKDIDITKNDEADDYTKSFGEIEYDRPGVYNYTLKEVIPENATDNGDGTYTKDGIAYDGHETKVVVTVTEDADGKLVAEKTCTATVSDPTTFKNKQAKGSLKITKNVTVAGAAVTDSTPANLKNLADGTYMFKVYSGETIAEGATPVKEVTLTITNGVSRTELVENLAPGYYTIKEVSGGTGKATLTSPKGGTVTVNVEPGKTGDDIKVATFTNDYDAEGEAKLKIKKALGKGNTWPGNAKVTFTLSGTGGTLPTTKTLDVKDFDEHSFGAITYGLADAGKTYTYTITETTDFGDDWTIEPAAGITATVKVGAANDLDSNGKLKTTVTYNPDTFTITNTKYEGKVQFKAKKAGNLKLRDKSFTVNLRGDADQSITLTQGETKNFNEITYSLDDLDGETEKTLTYNISEDVPTGLDEHKAKDGVTYDTTQYKVVVKLKKTTGKSDLVDSVTYYESTDGGKTWSEKSGDDITFEFNNDYNADGKAEFKAMKAGNGKLGDKTFTFQLLDADDNDKVLQTSPEVTQGKVASFTDIDYTLADLALYEDEEDPTKITGYARTKTINYKIREVIPDGATKNSEGKYELNHVVYDGTVKEYKVTLTDDGEGNIDVKYNGAETFATPSFSNDYDATGKAEFSAKKAANSKLGNKTFQFQLLNADKNDSVIQTSNPVKQGETANFTAINYTLDHLADHSDTEHPDRVTGYTAKDFKYKIREVIPETATEENNYTVDGVKYDKKVEEVTVTVEDNGDGTLKVTYDGKPEFDTPEFENEYSATGEGEVKVKKTLSGRTWTTNDSFEFTITPVGDAPAFENNEVTVTKDSIEYTESFGKVNFTKEGTYKYTVSETHKGETIKRVKYDSEDKTVTFVVKDDGKGHLVATSDSNLIQTAEFTNTYTADAPKFQKKIADINDSTDVEQAINTRIDWQDSADYDIGDMVPYKLTATLANDVTSYHKYHITFVDQMERSLTFDQNSVMVYLNNSPVDPSNYTLSNVGAQNFTLRLDWAGEGKDGLITNNALNGGTVDVYFKAQLNENAVLGNQGNVNGAQLKYSSKPDDFDDKDENEKRTTWDVVIAYTYEIDVSKVDPEGNELEGAEFQLEKFSKEQNKYVALGNDVVVTNGAGEKKNLFTVRGLDDGEYRLTETKAPKGYKAIDPVEFTVSATHKPEWTDQAAWFTFQLAKDDSVRTSLLETLTGKVTTGALGNLDSGIVTGTITDDELKAPTFEKKIQDINDSIGETSRSEWQDSADYDIRDAVPYKLTATLPEDVTNYKKYHITFTDQMEDTLKFKEIKSVKVNGKTVEATDYEFTQINDQKFTLTLRWGDRVDGKTRVGSINNALKNAKVTVEFTATLLDDANLGSQGNVNAAKLSYSNNATSDKEGTEDEKDDEGELDWDYVIAFTYKTEISKIDDVTQDALEGAEFKLQKKLADGTTKDLDLTVKDNVFTGKGLDDGDYVLTETKAPEGYQPIDPIEFTVSADHNGEWNYRSNAAEDPEYSPKDPARTDILTSLTGDVTSGKLELADDLAALTGNIENRKYGALEITKNVTLDGKPVTKKDYAMVDGVYSFAVVNKDGETVATPTITIKDGEANNVKVENLVAGTYTVTETDSKGLIPDEASKTVEVKDGKTAKVATVEFTNNKSGDASFEKKIMDTNDSTGVTSGWQDSADYDIGDAVPYKLTATLSNDVYTYRKYHITFEDELEATLDFNEITDVTLNGESIKNQALKGFKQDGDHKFTLTLTWGDGEHKIGKDANLDGAVVEVFFNATLNDEANFGSEGNINRARLHFSNNASSDDDGEKDEKTTDWDYVIAFTYKTEISKLDQDGEALEGAQFKLQKKLANGSLKDLELTVAGNVFTAKGLDDGIYVLTETKAPNGYKKADPITFEVKAAHTPLMDDLTYDNRTTVLTGLTGDVTSGVLKLEADEAYATLTGDVTNQGLGSLKVKKNVTATSGSEADGTYTFTVTGPNSYSKTVELKVEDGKSAEAQLNDLMPGEYTVTEGENEQGIYLLSENGQKVTVTPVNTANIPTAEFTNTKPDAPSFEKKIKDVNDSTGEVTKDGNSEWIDSADYDIGDPVPYKLTATLPQDVTDYTKYHITFSDVMEDSLDFNGVTRVTINGKRVAANDYTIGEVVGADEGHNFTLTLNWEGEDGAKIDDEDLNGAVVDVYFTATLNSKAKLGAEGNVNGAKLSYSNNPTSDTDGKKDEKSTDWDYVIAFTYKLGINKVTESGEALEGAEFILQKKLDGGALKDLTLSVKGNVFSAKGLDDGDYVLTETKAPRGYKPIKPIEFTVTADHDVEWKTGNDGDVNFEIADRGEVLTALTGETTVGTLELEADDDLAELVGNVENTELDKPEFEKKIADTNDSKQAEPEITSRPDKDWQDSADYDIGDAVPYRLWAKLPSDITSYKGYHLTFTDQMEKGLTFDGIAAVQVGDTTLDADQYEVTPESGGQKFKLTIRWGEQAAGKSVAGNITKALAGAEVKVFFTATLNDDAVLGKKGNVNGAKLAYSNDANEDAEDEDHEAELEWDYVIAFTYKIGINKVTEDGEALEGAEFKLQKKLAGGSTKNLKLTVAGNVFSAEGLDDGDYVLTETKAPRGHKPIKPINFTVSAEHEGEWKVRSAAAEAIDFDGEGRLELLTTLTGDEKTGTLELKADDDRAALVGDVENTELDKPEFEKKIADINDSDPSEEAQKPINQRADWQDSADYDIGDAVPYKLTATLSKDVTSFRKYHVTFEDELEPSLTFNKIEKVELVTKGEDGTTTEITDYDLKQTDDQHFTLTVAWAGKENEDGTHARIADATLNEADVNVYFTATLNENAKIGAEGNVNQARLHYSNNADSEDDNEKDEDTTDWDFVIAFTYKLQVNKTYVNNEPVEPPTFELQKKLKDGTLKEITLDENDCDGRNTFAFKGLDDGDYVLTETSPAGYDSIGSVEFTVTAEHTIEWKDKADREKILTGLTGTMAEGDEEEGAIELKLTPSEDHSTLSTDVVNTYSATGSFGLAASKIMVGGDKPAAGAFEFTATRTDIDGGWTSTANNDAEGNVAFELPEAEFTLTEADFKDAVRAEDGSRTITREYSITENRPADATQLDGSNYYVVVEQLPVEGDVIYHYRTTAYDGTNHVIKVTAVDDGHGNITCTMTNNDENVDTEGQDVPTANPLFTNDSSEDDEHRRFERDEDDADAMPEAKKVLMGADGKPEALEAGQFSFELVQLSDVVTMPDGTSTVITDQEQPVVGPDGSAIVVANDENGKVTFPTMYYGMGDIYHTFTYGIREVIPEGAEQQEDGTYVLDGITYDTSTKVFVVEVGWDPETKKVTSSTHYADAEGAELEDATFTNNRKDAGDSSFKPSVKKKLTGATLKDKQFTFEIKAVGGTDAEGNKLEEEELLKIDKPTAQNDKDGKVKFEAINYTAANIGNTYTFEITERNDKQSGITYDTKTITCTAKINGLGGDVKLSYSPNGTFTNKKPTNSNKKPSGSSSRSSLAKTGDPTSLASVAALAVAGAATLGYGVRRRRRQQ